MSRSFLSSAAAVGTAVGRPRLSTATRNQNCRGKNRANMEASCNKEWYAVGRLGYRNGRCQAVQASLGILCNRGGEHESVWAGNHGDRSWPGGGSASPGRSAGGAGQVAGRAA